MDPGFALAYNNRARAYMEKGHFDHAIQDLDKALQINPGYSVAYFLKGEYAQFKSNVMKAQPSIKVSNFH